MYVHIYAKDSHFPIDLAIFTKALRTDGRTDRRTDRRTDGWTNGCTMLVSYTDTIDASETDDFPIDLAIFTKSLRTLKDGQPKDQQTNGPIDQWADQQTD